MPQGSGVRPIFSYPYTAWLDQLGAYNAHQGVDRLLELYRLLQESGNFYWKGYVFPEQPSDLFPGFGTFETTMTVEPNSYVTGITGFSNQTAGFKYQMYDKGSRQFIFERTFAKNENAAPALGEATQITPPFGPMLLDSPLIILYPGEIWLEFGNLSANEARIQVFMTMAIPISSLSTNTPQMRRG